MLMDRPLNKKGKIDIDMEVSSPEATKEQDSQRVFINFGTFRSSLSGNNLGYNLRISLMSRP